MAESTPNNPHISSIERQRQRLERADLVGKLIDFVNGKIKLSADQERAAGRLLNKYMPDLKQVEHTGQVGLVTSREAVEKQLLEHGLDPQMVFGSMQRKPAIKAPEVIEHAPEPQETDPATD